MFVHVLSKEGDPLMPCHPAKARKLLKLGQAKPVRNKTGIFTIRLTYPTTTYTQPITVGVLPKAKYAAIAAEGNGKIFYTKVIQLRLDTTERLKERALHRRNRRYRKTRHRQARFENRTKTTCAACGENNVPRSNATRSTSRLSVCRPCRKLGKDGERRKIPIAPPSVAAKSLAILNDIVRLSRQLPITRIRVQVAQYDLHKMKDPSVQGVAYQHGTLFGEEIRQFVFARDKHKCAYCGGAEIPLTVDHVQPKARGGADTVDNLRSCCLECNQQKLARTLEGWRGTLSNSERDNTRRENIEKVVKWQKKGGSLRLVTHAHMYKNLLIYQLSEAFTQVEETWGAHTNHYRKSLNLPKNRAIEAMVIASEGDSFGLPTEHIRQRNYKKRRPFHMIYDKQSDPRTVKKQKVEYGEKGRRRYRQYKLPYTAITDACDGVEIGDRVEARNRNVGVIRGYVSARTKEGGIEIKGLFGEKYGIGKSGRVSAQRGNYKILRKRYGHGNLEQAALALEADNAEI